jgi:hypothetical protein
MTIRVEARTARIMTNVVGYVDIVDRIAHWTGHGGPSIGPLQSDGVQAACRR